MSHTIELRNVAKYYADEDAVSMGLSRINLDLDIGEFVAITGESGSGKSTLLNVISGLDTYEEGEMFVCGEDTTTYGTEDYEMYRKTYIGNIFQDFNLINSYTVYQNVEAVMLLSGKKKNECTEIIDDLIDQVGLSKYRNTKVSKLSGGQKQRVAIARALAKNAPIIVADEPTGNLDSASADAVIETLARVSKDRLAVVVTHNYEQAEPYVTRKITMHDGTIIEDIKAEASGVKEERSEDQLYDSLNKKSMIREKNGSKKADYTGISVPEKMKKSSEIGLGLRNAFNIPSKFLLLFIVYFFVSTAVLGQYATTKNSMYESDLLGNNPVFTNTSPERIIVKKADDSAFTDNDLALIEGIDNVNYIIENDAAVDAGVRVNIDDFYLEGPVVSSSLINEEELTFGYMPRNDDEIVIRLDPATDAYIIFATEGDDYIGKPVSLTDMSQMQAYEFDNETKIAGIILDEDSEHSPDYGIYGYTTIYASDSVSEEILASLMAYSSEYELDFGEVKIINDYGRAVYSSRNVPDGEVYLFDDQRYYYDDGKAAGEQFGLKVKNRFFESEGKYVVGKILKENNCEKMVGIPSNKYDSYFGSVFISSNDFRKLFDKGLYQISVFMNNEQKSDDTQKALNESGFTTLVMKDSLSDASGGFDKMLDLMTYARLALELIILFFIAYAVIRLIMKSRNSYYSTLRILGASKSNTDNILRVELILMMLIAYGVDVIFALLVSNDIVQNLTGMELKSVSRMLFYLTPIDYIMLGVLLLLMSLLIANTYSRNIFTKSAMKTFREEM